MPSEIEIITQPNIWHGTWGSITSPSSNPPIGWQWNETLVVWEYIGPTAAQLNMLFLTSTATCSPEPNVYSSS